MINSGDTAWVLASAALVLFMTPGLAIFYGGMVRAKSALNMMMMSFAAIGITTIIWVLYGYSLTFGTSQGGFIGDFGNIGLSGTLDQVVGARVMPTLKLGVNDGARTRDIPDQNRVLYQLSYVHHVVHSLPVVTRWLVPRFVRR